MMQAKKERKHVGRRPLTKVDRLRARAWAHIVCKNTGKTMHKLACELGVSEQYLYKIRRGDSLPRSLLFFDARARMVFEVGPYGVPVWSVICGDQLDFDFSDERVAPLALARITGKHPSSSIIRHPLSNLSSLSAEEYQIFEGWIRFCCLVRFYRSLHADLQRVENVGLIEVAILRIQDRISKNDDYEPREYGYPSPPTKDFDGPIPVYIENEIARAHLAEVVLPHFLQLEARMALKETDCEAFGFSADELIEATADAMRNQSR